MEENAINWEEAILKVLKSHGGKTSLNILKQEVPKLIVTTKSEDIDHTLRAYLNRLKTEKGLITSNKRAFYEIKDLNEISQNVTLKHKNYEILNLIGYGLSKFNDEFINEFGFSSKSAFYKYCVGIKIADTIGTVKNRMDLFDHFFPNNGRKGWWQKGDAYIHRKILIDNLFGDENVKEYASIVKLYLKENYRIKDILVDVKPIIKSRFKKLQETGLEAELYFINNFKLIEMFRGGFLEDARLYGDGYDFQVNVNENSYLTEIKGIREKKGKFRLTENEYKKASEYKTDYIITLVLNLNDLPTFLTIENPIKNLKFEERIIKSKETKEYQLINDIC